ncbi:free fatty acid receptor 4 isoform X1 [Microcaecilia unicolor]|uniref:Free fatty acid receptor 4 isoform X1 n=1 Tax=Microcaecilia unicolor TaxID=1415580 RepID=A0A6P7Y815_9AMPH|nr:free fatty acid receptor 4 isoform X1 [Microcaecilia unicolor]
MGAALANSPQAMAMANWTFFTFFSDFKGGDSVAFTVLETVVLSLVFLFSLLANVFAILLLSRKKRLVNANCFVLNLFCADLLFISMIPFILTTRWTQAWVLGEFLCHLLFYVMWLSGSASIISLAAVSLERMVCIMKLHQAASWNAKVVVGGLVAIWGYSALTGLPLALFFKVITQPVNGQEVQICTLIWPTVTEEIIWDVSFVLLDFIIPGLSIVISYSKILQITKATRKNLSVSAAYCENHQLRVSQQDFKLFRTLLALMISFFVMWSPIAIAVLLIMVRNIKKNFDIPSSLFFWIVTFTCSNSALNPVLYDVHQFKDEWKNVLCCFSSKRTDSTETIEKQNDNKRPNSSGMGK